MLDHVFTDAIGALRDALENALLERQMFEERFQADVLLGDLTWETSYGLPGEGSPPRVRADITLDWPTWAQTAYRSWYIGEPFEDGPRIEIELVLRMQRLAQTPDPGAVLAALPGDSPAIGREVLVRSGPTVETIYGEALDDAEFAIEVSYEGSYELDEDVLKDGSVLDDHFGSMGGWIASMLVRLGDLRFEYGPPDDEDAEVSDVVLSEVRERAAVVTLHRPESRNALNVELLRALPVALAAADADDGVDVIVLTGTDPAFCAGLDLKEIGAGGDTLRAGNATGERPSAHPAPWGPLTKPLIGAINGPAVTGGFELALQCDFLVASERARFADTHARVGIQPGWGLSVLLPQAVGLRRARQLSATGNYLDAATALAWGLVNEVVPHDELLGRCLQLAADISGTDQAAVRRLLATYRDGSLLTAGEALALETTVAADWARQGRVDPAAIERRRQAIVDRGRSQL